ncbi:MAG: adenosylcobinamide-GDP ribazoletransferase, partial [Candidatus Eisenbacteria bacterium]
GLALHSLAQAAALVTLDTWPEGLGLLLVLASVLLTRALHLDGLADWADSLGGNDRAARLAIMKDPHTGTFGTVALVAVLLAKWIAFTRLASSDTTLWIAAAFVASRTVQVQLAVRLPYARPEGGTGAPFVQGARSRHLAAAVFWAAVLLALLLGPAGLAALAAAAIVGAAFSTSCRRHVGGVTGDLLGAGSEISETLLLLAFATLGPHLPALTGWSLLLR